MNLIDVVGLTCNRGSPSAASRATSSSQEDDVALHIHDEELPGSAISRTFLGRDHGDVPVSFFVQASPPGHGPGPHRHPYAEVFVLHEGSGSFLAGDETIDARGGSVVVVPAGEVHGFTASGDGPLRMTCIHTHQEMITEWVEPG